MKVFDQKVVVWILPVLMLGMIAFFPGCAASRSSVNVQRVSTTRDGMIRGTLDLAGGGAGGAVLVEKIMPSRVTVGKPFEYVLHVINKTDCRFSDVLVRETFPEKYEMLKATPEASKTSEHSAEWTVGDLGPKETRTLTILGNAQEMSAMVACTKVTYLPMLCLGPETTVSGLKLTLEAPGQTVLCDGIAEKIRIENTGTDPMNDIKITQAFPEGLKTAEGKSSLEIRAGKLAGHETKSFDVKLKAQKAGSYAHKVRAMASNGLSISSATVTTVVTQPVLKIAMTGPEKVFMNRDAEFKITVENTGTSDAVGAAVTTKVPAGMKFVSASNGGTLSGDTVAWSLGVLEDQKAVSLGMTLKSIASGPVQLVAAAKGGCCQEVSASSKIDVQGIPAILLEANDTEDPIQVGALETFRVIVTNQGSAPDSHIILKINFEKNFDYVSSSGPTPARAESSKEIEFASLASLAPGQKATWEIKAKATEEGDHRASFHVKSDALGRAVEKVESTRVY